MTENEKIGIWVLLVIGFISLSIVFCVWDNSVRNDFSGNIEVWSEGEFHIEYDCFGDQTGVFIGDKKAPYHFYKLPPQNEKLNCERNYYSNILIEGDHYRVYHKTYGWFKWQSRYFIECIEKE